MNAAWLSTSVRRDRAPTSCWCMRRNAMVAASTERRRRPTLVDQMKRTFTVQSASIVLWPVHPPTLVFHHSRPARPGTMALLRLVSLPLYSLPASTHIEIVKSK